VVVHTHKHNVTTELQHDYYYFFFCLFRKYFSQIKAFANQWPMNSVNKKKTKQNKTKSKKQQQTTVILKTKQNKQQWLQIRCYNHSVSPQS